MKLKLNTLKIAFHVRMIGKGTLMITGSPETIHVSYYTFCCAVSLSIFTSCAVF